MRLRVTKHSRGPLTSPYTDWLVVNTILSREGASLGWPAGKRSGVASAGKVPHFLEAKGLADQQIYSSKIDAVLAPGFTAAAKLYWWTTPTPC